MGLGPLCLLQGLHGGGFRGGSEPAAAQKREKAKTRPLEKRETTTNKPLVFVAIYLGASLGIYFQDSLG